MSRIKSFKEQVRRNLVALISLAIAITSLGYNTWRNEASEHNRNQRLVSIEILTMLGDLQKAVLDARYGRESESREHLRNGWAITLTLRDIAMVAAGEVPESADELFTVWSAESSKLRRSEDAQRLIEDAVNEVRRNTHDVLRSLD